VKGCRGRDNLRKRRRGILAVSSPDALAAAVQLLVVGDPATTVIAPPEDRPVM